MKQNRTIELFKKAGWIGTTAFLAALFFVLGGTISLLDGDFSVALQAFIVVALLVAVGLFLLSRQKA